ncbi:MAG: helix-turn-helix transcriptional regulator [Clostridium perfringens]|nr:helix-turn-helix transcriptional regulator [Clostridium perfringens]
MFANRLKLLRNEKKLTQAEFAKLIKVAPSTIGMYESGSREPNMDTIKIIAKFFSVSSDYLIGLTDIRQNSDTILNKKDKIFIMDYIPNEAKKELEVFLSYIEYKYILSKDKGKI